VENLWEVEFKAGRRAFYINVNKVEFEPGDYVIVAAERGEDMGKVIREYLPTVNLKYHPTAVLRKAKDDDLGKLMSLLANA
jgi:cell fate regulator YaaT (PSP1 superfamily)